MVANTPPKVVGRRVLAEIALANPVTQGETSCYRTMQTRSAAAAAMPRKQCAKLAQGLMMAGRGMDPTEAHEKCGTPVSWAHFRREHNALQNDSSDDEEEEGDVAKLLQTPAIAPEVAESESGRCSQSSIASVARRTSRQVQVSESNKAKWDREFPCNFKIQFADATVDHLLRLEDYASSVSDGAGTWCLVSEDRSRTRKSSKAPVTKVVAVQKMDIGLDDVKGMPKGKRKELLALLQQADGEDED